MKNTKLNNFYDFFSVFPNEEKARLYFKKLRWGDTSHCGHCGSINTFECKDQKPMPYRCRNCRNHFSVRAGTTMSKSKLPYHKWLIAIYMMTTNKDNIPFDDMLREVSVSIKIMKFLDERIKKAYYS